MLVLCSQQPRGGRPSEGDNDLWPLPTRSYTQAVGVKGHRVVVRGTEYREDDDDGE